MPEAIWATEFIDGVFGRQLSNEERERLIEKTTFELNSIENHRQLHEYLHQAAAEIKGPNKRNIAISILFNVLIADGIVANEEADVFILLCEEWGIDIAEAANNKIPTMKDIHSALITAGVV